MTQDPEDCFVAVLLAMTQNPEDCFVAVLLAMTQNPEDCFALFAVTGGLSVIGGTQFIISSLKGTVPIKITIIF